MEHDIEVLRIRLDLWKLRDAERVFDRERMDVEQIEEQFPLGLADVDDVHPQHRTGGRGDPLWVNPVGASRGAVTVNEDGDHPGLWLSSCLRQRRLCRRQPRHGNPEGRATDVIESDLLKESDRVRIAAVLTADPELDVLARLTPLADGDVDE